jgi:hypothetical protein
MGMSIDGIIETFDPVADAGEGSWLIHGLKSPRHASPNEVLLYRAFGVLDGEGMAEEMEKAVSRHKNKKRTLSRLLDEDNIDSGPPRRIRRRIADSPKSTTPSPVLELSSQPAQSHSATDLSAHSLSSLTSLSGSSNSTQEPTSPVESASTVRRSPRQKNCRPNQDVAQRRRGADEGDDDDDEKLEPQAEESDGFQPSSDDGRESESEDDAKTSRKTRWPLKYVGPMAKGFDSMELESPEMTLQERFENVFQKSRYVKSTYERNCAHWTSATEQQKNKFIKAGCTKEGSWRRFVAEVTGRKRYTTMSRTGKFKQRRPNEQCMPRAN